jgi:hypothetical protein
MPFTRPAHHRQHSAEAKSLCHEVRSEGQHSCERGLDEVIIHTGDELRDQPAKHQADQDTAKETTKKSTTLSDRLN